MNKNKLLKIIGIAALIIAVPITVFIAQKRQETRQRAEAPTGQIQVYFADSDQTTPRTQALSLAPGAQVTLDLLLDTSNGTNLPVSGFDITFSYGTGLTLTNAVEQSGASSFNTPLFSNVDAAAKTFHFGKVNNDISVNASGLLRLGRFTFTAAQTGDSSLSFVSTPLITVPGYLDAVGVRTNAISYTIATPSPTSCPPGFAECASPPSNCHYEGGNSCSCGQLVCTTPSNRPPQVTNAILNNGPVRTDGSHQYEIKVYATDPDGGADIYNQYALINYQGPQAGQHRGMLVWSRDGTWRSIAPQWKNGTTSHQCTGPGGTVSDGGHASIETGYGDQYINLISCSTTIDQTVARITTFVVTFDPSFTSPTENFISGWAADSANHTNGWTLFQSFNLAPPTPGPVHPADLNRDHRITIEDFNQWLTALRNPSSGNGDINGDNTVDILDFNVWYTAMQTLGANCSGAYSYTGQEGSLVCAQP